MNHRLWQANMRLTDLLAVRLMEREMATPDMFATLEEEHQQAA